jgi:hypothetical protein
MRKLLINIFLTFFMLAAESAVFSAEPPLIPTFFSNEEISRINNGDIISRMYVKGNARGENSNEKIEIRVTIYDNEDFTVYEAIADEKSFLPYPLNSESKLKFYNILTSFSKLKGMLYYSRRDAKVTELVKDCYRVESRSGNKKPDIVYSSIKSKTTSMFLQKDNKFGKLIYRSELYNNGDDFVLVNTCLEPISALFINLNDSEEYKIISYFLYSPEKKGFFIYSVLAMRLKSNLALTNTAFGPTGFSNRLRASTVHLAKLIGLDWSNKYNAWPGKYDKY